MPGQALRQHLPALALRDAPAGGARRFGRWTGDVDADPVHLETARAVDGGDTALLRHDRAGGDDAQGDGGKDAAGLIRSHARLLTKQAWKSKRDVANRQS
ncbi:hypothetical protein ACVOMT_18625 [Sphingomonas panni]